MLKNPSQAVGNGFYEFAHFQTRGDGVVDFQQNAKPVALLPQLKLILLDLVEMKSIVDGDRNLVCHALQEQYVTFKFGRPAAAECHRPEAPQRRCQRQIAARFDSGALQ